MNVRDSIVLLFVGISVALGGSAAAEDLKPGDAAPAFKLPGSDGKTHSLADYHGKTVIVAWFPKAFTPGCTIECKSMKSDGEALRKYDVAYFTASVDTAEQNKKFAESLGLDFPILSDPAGDVARAYGVVDDHQTKARRWTFIVGPDGKLLAIDKQVKTAGYGKTLAAKLSDLGVAKK